MKSIPLIAAILSVLCLCSCGSRNDESSAKVPFEPRPVANLSELQQSPEFTNYVLTSRFGAAWPATLVDIVEGDDEIRFSVNGRPHLNRGYTGYHLKVAKLTGTDGREMAFVFRSETKR